MMRRVVTCTSERRCINAIWEWTHVSRPSYWKWVMLPWAFTMHIEICDLYECKEKCNRKLNLWPLDSGQEPGAIHLNGLQSLRPSLELKNGSHSSRFEPRPSCTTVRLLPPWATCQDRHLIAFLICELKVFSESLKKNTKFRLHPTKVCVACVVFSQCSLFSWLKKDMKSSMETLTKKFLHNSHLSVTLRFFVLIASDSRF